MHILVSAASKHGATAEIAAAVAETLSDRGFRVTLKNPIEVGHLGRYSAVVLGSAVYAGRWLEPARTLAERVGHELAGRSVWLFSSGPIGDPPQPGEDPVDANAMIEATAARGHKVFAGRLERSRLSFGERAIVRALRAPEGDFRDWDDITAWAEEIATALQPDTASR